MGLLILGSLESIEDSLVIPTQKLTEDIAALFLLLSNSYHTGSDQDYIHNSKYNYYGDGVMLISMSPSKDIVQRMILCVADSLTSRWGGWSIP